MKHFFKGLDIMPGYRDFLFVVSCHGEEEGSIVLGLDFVDHGQVHDIAFMGTEEAQGG